MKILLDNIEQEQTITINGKEAWLDRIYSDFSDDPSDPALITGQLKVTREADDGALIEGQLAFAPAIPCSRCTQAIKLELNLKISTRFYPEIDNPDRAENWRRERNLSRAELDAYYIHQGEMDLEEVVNDSVYAQIPSSFIPESNDQHPCIADQTDARGIRVFGKQQSQHEASPFGALKDIKLSH